MKKLTAILLFVCAVFCAGGAYAVDSYEECKQQVFMAVAFNRAPQEYTAILDNLVNEAKTKAANWAKTPINSKNLFCELNGVTVYNAACENKTPTECGVPEGCWCLLAGVSCEKIFHEQAAREKYTEQKCGNLLKQERAQPAENTDSSKNNSTEINAKPQDKPDNTTQKDINKKIEQDFINAANQLEEAYNKKVNELIKRAQGI